MGDIPEQLLAELRDALDLERGIETGTLKGGGARVLARNFPRALTIELSPELHAEAASELRHIDNVECLQGDSREILSGLVEPQTPTFYWLDGHWSGSGTAGATDQCPVIGELAAIAPGHPDDCIVIDDARLFAATPLPPHDPDHWPTLLEVFDAIRAAHADHHVTVLHDLIIAVPRRARPIADAFGNRPAPEPPVLFEPTGLRAAIVRRARRLAVS